MCRPAALTIYAGVSPLHDRNSAHTHPQILMNFRQMLVASRKRNNTLTFSCPCAHCPPLSPSIELSSLFLVYAIEVVRSVLPVKKKEYDEKLISEVISENKIFYY